MNKAIIFDTETIGNLIYILKKSCKSTSKIKLTERTVFGECIDTKAKDW